MAEKKVQIGFRVTEAFQRRMETERIKREISTQDMIQTALKFWFDTPRDQDSWTHADIRFIDAKDKEDQEATAWISLFEKYIDKMPREKVLFLVEMMKLDLSHYKSSRRKR